MATYWVETGHGGTDSGRGTANIQFSGQLTRLPGPAQAYL